MKRRTLTIGAFAALFTLLGTHAVHATTYDSATQDTSTAGSDIATVDADAASATDGTFEVTASVDQATLHVERAAATAGSSAFVFKSFTMAAGSYVARIHVSDIQSSATASGLASAWSHFRATVNCDCTVQESGSGPQFMADAGPTDALPDPPVPAEDEALVFFTLHTDGAVQVEANAIAFAQSGEGQESPCVSPSGGTGAASFSGTFDSVTIDPA